jgi:viroplasmin and RNaseH domain-containing protein
MKKWYVVYQGHVPGVYEEWEDCLKQVNKFKGNNHKSYKSKAEAEARYLNHLLAEERKNQMKSNIIVNNHNCYNCKAETDARYLNHLLAEERKNRMKSNFIVIPFLLIVIVILLYVIVI